VLAVLADAHLGGPGGRADPLIQQLEALPAPGCTRLILLGDLFQAWVGLPKFETPEIAAVVAALARLRERGVAIDYVEGNRDFFLRGSVYEPALGRVGLETSATVGGRRILFVHGDGLNDRDRQYLFWRWLSKRGWVRLLLRALPRAAARRFVASTERRLGDTNFKHKARIPEEAIRAYGARRLAEGYDLLVLGHFHEAREWSVAGGTVRLLEAWFTSRRIEWIS
jgi:UDP-2,3-diacylglucosamine hydrolase